MNDAEVCIQPPQQTTESAASLSTADVPLPLLSVSTTLVELQTLDDVSVDMLSASHAHRHPSKRKYLKPPSHTADADSVAAAAARHVQYLERRRKNNVASKRSRETRKRRLMSMEEEVCQLEQRNARLRQRVAELEKLTQFMKSAVIDALRDAP